MYGVLTCIIKLKQNTTRCRSGSYGKYRIALAAHQILNYLSPKKMNRSTTNQPPRNTTKKHYEGNGYHRELWHLCGEKRVCCVRLFICFFWARVVSSLRMLRVCGCAGRGYISVLLCFLYALRNPRFSAAGY